MYDQLVKEIEANDKKIALENPTPVPTPAEPVAEPTLAVEPAASEPTPAAEPNSTEPASKAWYEDDDSASPEPKTNDAPSPQTLVEDEDEDIALIKEFKKQGKTLKEFVEQYRVEDVSKFTDTQIIEKALKELEGFEGDEFEQAMSEVETMPLFQKKKLIQEYRAKYNEMNQEKLKQLSSSSNKTSEKQSELMNRFQTELTQTAESMKGQEKYGLKITDEMSSKISKFISDEISLTRRDGSMDVDFLVDVAMWRLYGKDVVKANVTKAKNEGREEMLRATTNPSTGMSNSNSNPSFGGTEVEDAFNAYLNKK
tara:strand:- start:4228 stop:5163 length:936 start_codon:yes stop_codon:yes gene_type:complete